MSSIFTSEYGQVTVKKLHPNAKLPIRANPTDAGLDLHSLDGGVVPARGKAIIKTGISIQMPVYENGYGIVGFVKSRSGLSAKNDLEVGAGVIDFSYNGELMVILRNHSDIDFHFEPGTRVAQLVCIPVYLPSVREVDELVDSGRGGFGSSGLN